MKSPKITVISQEELAQKFLEYGKTHMHYEQAQMGEALLSIIDEQTLPACRPYLLGERCAIVARLRTAPLIEMAALYHPFFHHNFLLTLEYAPNNSRPEDIAGKIMQLEEACKAEIYTNGYGACHFTSPSNPSVGRHGKPWMTHYKCLDQRLAAIGEQVRQSYDAAAWKHHERYLVASTALQIS